MKIRKINKTERAIVGDCVINSPLGNEIEVSIDAFTKQGGEYRLMPYKVPPGPFCDFLIKDE